MDAAIIAAMRGIIAIIAPPGKNIDTKTIEQTKQNNIIQKQI
jgi:hypothetical protein